MAKKTQAVQLQAEINSEDEWEKLLQRDGLIVVDVFSEWCGPCSGMSATLKKLKLEIGGDLLQLAMAKCDYIEALKRFRGKSEPTWMFIVNRKLVNFMFGANSPKLTRVIIEELKKEQDCRAGRRERIEMEITEITEEEQQRLDVIIGRETALREKEERKKAKELFERRMTECKHILENLSHMGVVVIFQHARTKYREVLDDLFGEAGLTVNQTEKYTIKEEELAELFYFLDGECPFDEDALDELLNEESIILLVKPMPARDVTEETDDLLKEILYGSSKQPPGGKESPAYILSQVEQPPNEDGEEQPPLTLMGVWTPENELVKATALRLFFIRLVENFIIPEPEPTPPHYAVIFEAYRRQEVAEFLEKWQDEVIRYGFFTSEVPEETELIAKSTKKFEKSPLKGAENKLVIELSKKKSECVLGIAQLNPTYMSPNTFEGERECRIFFPDDYDEPPSEEEPEPEPEDEPPKKGKKKQVVKETSEHPSEPVEGEDFTSTQAEEEGVDDDVQSVGEAETGEGEMTEDTATDTEATETIQDAEATTTTAETTDVATTDEESPA